MRDRIPSNEDSHLTVFNSEPGEQFAVHDRYHMISISKSKQRISTMSTAKDTNRGSEDSTYPVNSYGGQIVVTHNLSVETNRIV